MPNTPQEAPKTPEDPAQPIVTEAMLAAGRTFLADDAALSAVYAAMAAVAPRVQREADPVVAELSGALKLALQALGTAGQRQTVDPAEVGRIKVVVNALMTSLRAGVAAHEQAAIGWIPAAKLALEQAHEVLP